MRNRKYILDMSDLQYKQVRLPWKHKILRMFLWLAGSLAISVLYLTIFENIFGSPKEFKLNQDIEALKFKYSMLDKDYSNAYSRIDYLMQADERHYRPFLGMDALPESYKNPGYGGVNRYRDLEGLANSTLMISAREKLDGINLLTKVQGESFNTIELTLVEWQRMQDHLPKICPVDPAITRGDGLKFREKHPVWGIGQWHHGQDFNAPYGSEVFATGNGTVTVAGWSSNGFGNYVTVDHGYGYQTIYGHLSKINVSVGLNVKRGDLLGLSGNSGTSSGPHLHYQIDLNGNHSNPLYFFNDDLTTDEYREMIMILSSKSKY